MTEAVEEQKTQGFETEPKLFSRWSYKDVTISDPCFIDYVAIHNSRSMVFTPHTAGRYQAKSFRKAACPIVERLVGSMQFAGRNTGKKAKAIRIIRHTFEIIHLLTGENPLEVFIRAVMNSGPREDSTKIGSGSGRKQAVDVSPLRRVNMGIYLITQGSTTLTQEPESTPSASPRPSPSACPTRSSTPPPTTPRPPTPSARRRRLRRSPRVTVDPIFNIKRWYSCI